ncbi:hypothetical protein F7734_18955 [Scytonema sp. UIC 10036]|uniref:hypothetical protein n=1 Tax=Scytonema sp. UIC 10036 TaxID=2304196 RepID=UPI0012DA042C|nr:hypothetical protein [Scytonema sp. UIC 10036]MUG94342.1 hypothetical protein [Scytonema sp. UIC 10036]
MRMHQEGEAIRDGLLQKSFIIRRHLELSLSDRAENQQQQNQSYLETIEKFHSSLKKLSEYLSPPYIDDNLPLAIRSLLESWKLRISVLNLELELPTELAQEREKYNHVIFMALEELLQIMLSDIPSSSPISLFVSLRSQGNLYELVVQVTNCTVSEITYNSHLTEFNYLRHAFKFLTSGECFHHQVDRTDTWYFRWSRSHVAAREINNPLDCEAIVQKPL